MNYVDIPVIDLTGLHGFYKVALDVPGGPNYRRAAARAALAPASEGGGTAQPFGEASTPSGVSILASVQKLGLFLERRSAPLDHIVVDHVDRVPTPD
jgi:uncharacterized protein (TIGR03435 family)